MNISWTWPIEFLQVLTLQHKSQQLINETHNCVEPAHRQTENDVIWQPEKSEIVLNKEFTCVDGFNMVFDVVYSEKIQKMLRIVKSLFLSTENERENE